MELRLPGRPSSPVAFSNTGTISAGTEHRGGHQRSAQRIDFGTIVGTGGTAIDLSAIPAAIHSRSAVGYSITGNVLGSGSDTLQLGGDGAGSFDLGAIGTQFDGFSAFDVDKRYLDAGTAL